MDIRAMADEEPSSQETDVNWVWMAPGRRGSAPPPLRNISHPGPRNVHFQDTPTTPSEPPPPASVQLHNLGLRNQQIQLQQFRDMHLSQQQQQQNSNSVPTTITITPPPFISSSPSFSGFAFSQGQTAMRAPMGGEGASRPMEEDQQTVALPQIQDGQLPTPIAYATVTQLPPSSTIPSPISNPIPIPMSKFSPVSGSYFVSPTSFSPPPVMSPPMSPTFGSPSPNSSAGSSPNSSRSTSPSRAASSSSSSSSSTPKRMSNDKHSPTAPGDKNKPWKFKTHPYSFKTQQHSKSTKFKFHYFQPEIVEQAEGGTITKLRKTM